MNTEVNSMNIRTGVGTSLNMRMNMNTEVNSMGMGTGIAMGMSMA